MYNRAHIHTHTRAVELVCSEALPSPFEDGCTKMKFKRALKFYFGSITPQRLVCKLGSFDQTCVAFSKTIVQNA